MPSITDLLPFLTTTRPQGTDGLAGLSGPLDLTPPLPHMRKATVPPPGGQKANRVFSTVDTAVLYSSTPPRYSDFHSYLQAYKLPWVNACVKVIAFNAANVGKKLVRPSPDGDESKDVEVTSSPFLDLLRKPNPNDTYFSLFELIISDMELTGNAYLALEGLDGAGRPAEVYRVAPDRMTVLPATDRLVAGYRYWVSGKQSITYQPEEIIHIKYPNPCDHLYGMGIIEAGEARFDSERAMAEHERQFWNNGAKITGVLQTDGQVDGTTWERIRDSVRRFFQGKGYSTLILEAGLKYQSVSDGPAKLGMLEMAKASRDMILAMFGVPSTKLGILENANYKALASDEFFWCFVAGTSISTYHKSVNIEDVQVGDLLLTHEGRYRPVVETRSREYHGRLYTVTLAKHARPLVVSEEHPFYVQRDGREVWVKVGDLCVGDMVLGRRLVADGANPWREVPYVSVNGRGTGPARPLEITPEVGRLIGIYLAEGHVVRTPDTKGVQRVDFALGAHETALIGETVTGLTRFGKSGASSPRRGGVVVRGGRAAAEFFRQFGENAGTKHIPTWLLQAPDGVLAAVLAGYWDGDGVVEHYRLRAGTVSEQLADDLRLALTRLGMVPHVRLDKAYQRQSNGTTLNARPMWVLSLTGPDATRGRALFGYPAITFDPRGRATKKTSAVVDERFVSYRVEALEWRQADGERIYNMEVAEDHSYTAEGVLAHNSETVSPKLTRMEQALEQLCERFHPGAGLVLKFDRLNFEDDLPKAQVAEAMAKTGALMVDELREYLELPRLPDDAGQVVLVQSALVPLDQATAPPPPPPPMLPPGATPLPVGLLEAGTPPAAPANGTPAAPPALPTPPAAGGQRNG